jgi:predicted helicase
MSQLLIAQFFNELDRLRKISGTNRESVVREAFKDLLKAWGKQHDLVFIPEYEYETPVKTRVYPDGALLYSLRVPLGYWEAKDEDDDLDREIDKKKRKGYPQDNIIFEDSRQAVLIQNRQEVLRVSYEDPKALERLLTLFFAYERPEIGEFRKAVEQFKRDLPAVLAALREKIVAASNASKAFARAEKKFLAHARDTINPAVTAEDVREMLIQHILTEDIFARVFDDGDFHRQNNVAKELYALEDRFFTGAAKKNALRQLEPYYAAIRTAASQIPSHAEKQTFLKVIYENFYKVYNPKAADRLGVIYTPNEIVRFMIESADWLCEKHFSKNLIDRGVEILDPAAGTGTFICELLQHFRGQKQKLAYKYKEELHANEVAILPYYVANLNIEATFASISGQYAEYPNLCFVDTLDNVAGLGKFSGHQEDLFGAMSEENVARIKRQNKRKISVIIGNPPYNANQQNENDNNKNRDYPRIDARIKATYIKESTAQKTKLYDMYARFFRWASDRINDEGIIAFVSNRSFLDARTFDGFRKIVARDFNEIWVIDLKGNARTSGERRRQEGGNVFDNQIRVGIAVYFCIKNPKSKGCNIFFESIRDYAKGDEKIDFLVAKKLYEREFEKIKPDSDGSWLNQSDNDFESFIPIASKQTKLAKSKGFERAIFKLFSLGAVTSRDDWVYDLTKKELETKVKFAIDIYNSERQRLSGSKICDCAQELDYSVKWTRRVKADLKNGKVYKYDPQNIVVANYRPFKKMLYYRDEGLTEFLYQTPQIFGVGSVINPSITIMGDSTGKPYFCLAIDRIPDLNFVSPASGGTQTFPLKRLDKQESCIDNITDWALEQFRSHYAEQVSATDPSPGASRHPLPRGERGLAPLSPISPSPLAGEGGSPKAKRMRGLQKTAEITKDDIFHYVYAVLHDPVYREKYALNLKREFPRIPFYPDFRRWVVWGEKLMKLHIGYETVEPWKLKRTDAKDEKAARAGVAPKTILKADRDNGIIVLDSETQLSGIPASAWDYRLGTRSALDWILDQYKEKTPKDPTIREKFNTYRFADYKETVVDLLARVTRVSVETVAIVEAMRALPRGYPFFRQPACGGAPSSGSPTAYPSSDPAARGHLLPQGEKGAPLSPCGRGWRKAPGEGAAAQRGRMRGAKA